MKNWTGQYSCDGGALRVYGTDMAIHWLNRVGDGTFNVEVNYTDGYSYRIGKFLGSFDVFNIAFISDYDLENNAIYSLPKGRYAVFAHENGDMTLVWWD